MRGPRNKASEPRAVGGGRSPRYDGRRAARGATRGYASEWGDASAHAVLQQLKDESKAAGEHLQQYTGWVLGASDRVHAFVSRLKAALSPHDRDVAASIMLVHVQKVLAAGAANLGRRVHSFLKPLRERRSARTPATELDIAEVRLS